MADQSLIDARGLTLELDRTPILTNVTLEVRAGTAVGLTGANGSGKTSLLRCLATLQRPTTGQLAVLGADGMGPDRRTVRHLITLIGHEPGLYPSLTLEENLSLVARMLGRDQTAASRALQAVGLAGTAARPFGAASKGMVRRTELARVLIQRPRLLLLDEAHAGLDASSSELVDQVVGRVVEAGGAAVVVSHEPGRLDGVVGGLFHLTGGVLERLA